MNDKIKSGLWFILLWVGGVISVSLLAFFIKFLMQGVNLIS